MEKLSRKELELVALGASLGSNCIPCIAYHISAARECGLTDQQIREAIEMADKIRKVPGELVLNTAYAQLDSSSESPPSQQGSGESCCGC